MKIISLIENNKKDKRLLSEHGLSIYLEVNGRKILFDTGSSNKFIKNAKTLDLELEKLDDIIISHGHVDHISGLKYVNNFSNLKHVYMSNHALEDYWIKIGLFYKRINISRNDIKHLQEKIIFIEENTEIEEGIFLLPIKNDVPQKTNLYKGASKNRVLDDFYHEVILVIIENNELVVFSGCSHTGIINILNRVISSFPNLPIKAVIGGFHLIKLPYINNLNMKDSEVLMLGKQLEKFNVQTYYSCHCTGPKGFDLLKQSMKSKLQSFDTGEIVEI